MITITAASVDEAYAQLGGKPEPAPISIRWRQAQGAQWGDPQPGCIISCFQWQTPREFEKAEEAIEALRQLLTSRDESARQRRGE